MTAQTTNFNKLTLDLNQFIPLFPHQTLALHLGTGLGFGDIPVGEYFWVGGANTVRGYFSNEFKYGTKRLLGNVEYRCTFNEMLQGVIFFDWGNAWNAGAPTFDEFLSGRGLGLRLNTPMGPIRLDYGIAQGRDQGKIDLSIGHAF